jgi:predicted NBD/HSP70 family sugar kinase
MPFTAIFQQLGLRRPGSAAVDSDALLQALDDQPVRAAVAAAVSGVVAALTALADPEVVLLGGTWGLHAGLLTAVREALNEQPRRPRVAHASVAEEPSLAGARRQAIAMLRDLLVEASRAPAGQPATP